MKRAPNILSGALLRERPDVATFIKLKIPVIFQKRKHGENKIHIDVKQFTKELPISSSLAERLTDSFGLPIKHNLREKREPIDRIELAKTYSKLMENGTFKTKAELARHLGVSRAWITIVMNTLKYKKQT